MLANEDIKLLLDVQQKAYKEVTELLFKDLSDRLKLLE